MKTTAGKIAAAYKASQVNLAGLVKDVGNKILLLTAPNIGAGVTTSVLTLASELQQSTGEPIVLVDLSSAENSLTRAFAQQEYKDLWELIADSADARKHVLRLDKQELYLLPSRQGKEITRRELVAVLARLVEQFRFVIIDADPVYANNSAVENCSLADALILVIRAEETRWEVAKAARQRLEQSGANVAGCIFNDRKYYTPGWFYNKL